MEYSLLRTVHVAAVVVTLFLFLLRGYWMLTNSPHLAQRWVRVAPHTNDTVLLAAAISMLAAGGLNPLQHPWLMAKITGLLVYIGLGTVALKRGRSKGVRVAALIGALVTFVYIVAVAVTKQVIPGVGA